MLSNLLEYLRSKINQYENFISFIIISITSIFLIVFILYLINLNVLKSREENNMNKLYPKLDGNLRSISDSDPDCSGNLYDYYIKTAFNSCSGGSYKNDYVSIDILKTVINQGVRCLDFEIYSIDDEPVVATSTNNNYYMKETFNSLSFSSVMEIIRNYCFSSGTCPNPNDPLIVHLRCKSNNQKMYDNLAKIFNKNSDIMLGASYSFESTGKNLGAAPLLSLRQKLILIIDRSNNAFLENKKLLEYVNLTSNSELMRKYNFNNIKDNADLNELIRFNKKCMTIVLPDSGANPDNPDGKLCRENGCQMVAMRYQLNDDSLKENTGFFDSKTYAFVLKPKNLRSDNATQSVAQVQLASPVQVAK